MTQISVDNTRVRKEKVKKRTTKKKSRNLPENISFAEREIFFLFLAFNYLLRWTVGLGVCWKEVR
jgi:hypothetical protein